MIVSPDLKIAISGGVATGKSTLSAELARRTGLPVVREGMAELAQASEEFGRLLADRSIDSAGLAPARARLVGEFEGWVLSRAAARADLEGFVCDRWELDLLAWWLMANIHGADAVTAKLTRSFSIAARDLDYCVVTPFGKQLGAIGETNSDGQVRNFSLTSRVAFHALLVGLKIDFVPLRVIRLPVDLDTVEERAEFIERAISRDQVRKASSN